MLLSGAGVGVGANVGAGVGVAVGCGGVDDGGGGDVGDGVGVAISAVEPEETMTAVGVVCGEAPPRLSRLASGLGGDVGVGKRSAASVGASGGGASSAGVAVDANTGVSTAVGRGDSTVGLTAGAVPTAGVHETMASAATDRSASSRRIGPDSTQDGGVRQSEIPQNARAGTTRVLDTPQ